MNILRFLAAGAILISSASAYEVTDTVRYVVDGDTVKFKTMNCRFANVDTPESGNNAKARKDIQRFNLSPETVYSAGRIAKNYTKSHIRKGESYRIDVKKQDRYGRNVCEIFLPNGESFNQKIVQDGFAVPFWRYITKHEKGTYYGLAKTAEKRNKGLWKISPKLMLNMLKN